jgi:Bifunctional DNA primase/polymerase, N-terminal
MTAHMLAQALAYAVRGWPVFPCRPDQGECPYLPPRKCQCKAPLGAAVPNGCLDATTDPGRIRAWWRSWPAANVAIATGAPGPDVLDIDVDQAGSGYRALNKLIGAGVASGASIMVRTPRGGAHIYYAGTGQGCHRLGRHHLDFKATGGYVLAPSSTIHGGRTYRLLDQQPAAKSLDWDAVIRVLDPPRQRTATPQTWSGDDLPPKVQRALAADDSDRSVALYRLVGACVRSGMDEAAIYQLAGGYQPALEKYGPRLDTEVTRCLRRIGAA